MPSKSRTQQRLMGAAYAFASGENKDVPKAAKDVAKSFLKGAKTKGEKTKAIKKLRDFAKTKHKGLPEKLEEKVLRFEDFVKENYS